MERQPGEGKVVARPAAPLRALLQPPARQTFCFILSGAPRDLRRGDLSCARPSRDPAPRPLRRLGPGDR